MSAMPKTTKSGSDHANTKLMSVNKYHVNVDKLTSDLYTKECPPVDWADMALLVPHEAIRHQMSMMVQSANALPDHPKEDELWKVTFFAKWYTDYFFVSVLAHHHAEEEIYFPWIKSKTEYPEKKFSKDHESLRDDMEALKAACETICQKGGKLCNAEINILKTKMPTFEKEMRVHLKEEEESVPNLLRENFTQEEEKKIVQKILQTEGLEMTRKFLPAVVLAMHEWASSEYYEEIFASIPPPIKHMAFKYYLPNFENVAMQMRDAPTLEKKPQLKKVGCCGLSFCFPCIL